MRLGQPWSFFLWGYAFVALAFIFIAPIVPSWIFTAVVFVPRPVAPSASLFSWVAETRQSEGGTVQTNRVIKQLKVPLGIEHMKNIGNMDTETKDDVSSVKMNSEQSNQWHRSGVAHPFDPRNIQIISLDNPRAFMHKGFLLESECDLLMEYAKPSMYKSGVVDVSNGGSSFSDIRTSTGSFVPTGMNDEIRRVERRIAAWSQIPATHGEPIQVLRYQIGQEYQSHFDYFFHEGGKNNNRIATVLMYLSDVKDGGETAFPNLKSSGLRPETTACAKNGLTVVPRKGDAILFWNMKVGGDLDGGSSHAGCPVILGEKWTATKWIHVAPSTQLDARQRVLKEGRETTFGECRDSNIQCDVWAEQNECEKNPQYMLDTCRLSCHRCTGIWREASYV